MPRKARAKRKRAVDPSRSASRKGHPLRFANPAEVKAVMEESIDREIERWARKLLLVGDGEVRKLTEEEVRVMVGKKRKAPKPDVNRKSKGSKAKQRFARVRKRP